MNQKILKRLERMEHKAKTLKDNAGLLETEAAILREELSGGSDSSNLSVLTSTQREKLRTKRRKTQLG